MFLALIFISPTVFAEDGELSSSRYLGAVRLFADTVLEHGRDVYGEKKTPLFSDGLHVETFEPARWISKDGDVWVLSNFASQQSLMRLLDGLTGLTGEAKYREAAETATRYVLKHVRSENGLIYWGGHSAWDLRGDRPVGEHHLTHEIRHQPYFDLMWRIDPKATREVIETMWAGHIKDWSKLDYDRHARTTMPYAPQWDHEFDMSTEVPFAACGPRGKNLAFCGVTCPLVQGGTLLAVLDEDERVLKWTRRFVHRWQEACDPKTGLSGSLMSYRVKRPDRAKEAFIHVHPNVCEAKLAAQGVRYNKLPLTQMRAAERLLAKGREYAKVGREFLKWASADLKTLARHCYDEEKDRFIVKLTDGTPLKWREAKRGYFIPETFAPTRPSDLTFWAYATAYRMTGDREHWRVMRKMGPGLGIGDMGEPDGNKRRLDESPQRRSFRMIYALLELQRATGDDAFLELACAMGDRLRELQTETGLFPRPAKEFPEEGKALSHAIIPGTEDPPRKYARTSDEVPLALLHLAAALEGKSDRLPKPVWDKQYFHCRYGGELEDYQKKRDDSRTYDNRVFYGEGL
jgi:pectate lyase